MTTAEKIRAVACSFCRRTTGDPKTWLPMLRTDPVTHVVTREWRCPRCKEAMWDKRRSLKARDARARYDRSQEAIDRMWRS